MNLNYFLEQVVTDRGSEIAMSHPGGEVTYATFYDAVRRLASGFTQLGLGRGDRIAIMLPNIPQLPIVYYAALRIGAVVVPVNTMYKGREAAWLLENSEAKILVTWHGSYESLARHISHFTFLEHVVMLGEAIPPDTVDLTQLLSNSRPSNDLVDVDMDDPAVVQYTSGVTGSPKGSEITHGNIISNVRACREIMKVTPRDIFVAALPLFHPMGQTLLMHLAFAVGAVLDLHPKFDPEKVLGYFREGKGTLFIGVPSMFRMILNSIEEDEEPVEESLRLCICGGDSLPDDVLKRFEKQFGTYILECYITSETSPVISFNQWRTGRRVGSLGHPVPGVEMKVIDERGNEASIGEVGEIVIKGDNVMRGYINRPRLTAETLRSGWFHTGDLGKMDINGFFYLVDRLNDRILKGGFSIYPSEVEEVLYCHPDVSEAAVVGIPDEVMGQEVKACVVLKDDATVTTEQLSGYCRERMALYKVPAVIRFYHDLPRTPNGRINKLELRN
ncbi:MAG: long-chain fatty acid--CoA ligase [Candidatus Electryoneaceae bacterium]|nr:long-chain fatty acid--CoA ligase [Candidatus Electryoneaceae bacterium]